MFPLWDEDGLTFKDGEELVGGWRISKELAARVVAWGEQDGPELDAERLIGLLNTELGHVCSNSSTTHDPYCTR